MFKPIRFFVKNTKHFKIHFTNNDGDRANFNGVHNRTTFERPWAMEKQIVPLRNFYLTGGCALILSFFEIFVDQLKYN